MTAPEARVHRVDDVARSQAQLQALLDDIQDPAWLLDSEGRLVAFNNALRRQCAMLSLPEPRVGIRYSEILHGDSRGELHSFWDDLVQRALGGRSVLADSAYTVRGVKHYIGVSTVPVVIGSRVDGAVFIVHDLTPARRREQNDLIELALTRIFSSGDTVEESLERTLEFLCESEGWDLGVAWLVEPESGHLIPSAVFSTLGPLGARFAEQVRAMNFPYGHGLPGRVWKNGEVIWVPDLLDETSMTRATLAVDAGFHSILLFPLREADRRIGVVELFARAVRPINEESVSVMKYTGAAIGRLLHRQRTEEERMELHRVIERKGNEWALTFDAIESPIFLVTFDGVILRVNRAARDFINLAYGDIVGRRLPEFGIGEPWTTLSEVVSAVRDSRTPCSAQISGYGHEMPRYWDVNATFYKTEDDEEDARIVVVMRDMTTLVQLQEFVRVGEQMSALGELVAGVAHEVRNPLFGMSATLEAYEPSLGKTAEAQEFFGALRHWIDRLNVLMENLLEYGKSWSVNLRDGCLEDVVEQAVEACRPMAAGARIEVVNSTEEENLVILMDPARLVNAFQNLIINAVQHSPPRAPVVIEAKRSDEGGTPFIECTVVDRGPGFAAGDLGKIFQPFFTRRRGGTGLGLSIVQRVIEEHGGSVSAANNPDGGAIIRVRFPAFLR